MLYPNATSGNITLETTLVKGRWNYQLISITGQIVKQGVIKDLKTNLGITNLESGIYFLKMKSAEQTKVIKEVKGDKQLLVKILYYENIFIF